MKQEQFEEDASSYGATGILVSVGIVVFVGAISMIVMGFAASGYYGVGAMVPIFQMIVTVLIAGAFIAGECAATGVLVKIAQSKGHFLKKPFWLWLIGLCATPITLGVLVIALPKEDTESSDKAVVDDLPAF